MRVEPYGAGSILHVIKRGARGLEIVRDERDRQRFLKLLYFLNDEYQGGNGWERDMDGLPPFTRPKYWPAWHPLVDVLGWTLLSNHLHLLIRVRDEGEKGVSEFLHRLFRSMTGHFNEKYNERGSIFQGPYKSRTVDNDDYLRYVVPYIMVKNTLEMHPDGFEKAAANFDSAWKWAIQYPYSSLGVYAGEMVSPVVMKNNIIHELFPTPRTFKEASRDMLHAYREKRKDLRALQLEE
ncbi:hypothetical protein FJY93_04375 [Candidatus Kaiserbacteria bacterium]|nr:hypothetical protein [Candidatus Kaiserbacteria bacterium]